MAPRSRVKPVAARLIEWFCAGHRDLPWRRTSDPYRIWVSEIMLQQTRAQAVIPYYERFLDRFPTVEALAAAPEDDVLALWSGLGYYSRARNLRDAARQIAAAGGFPCDFAGLRALPGIGDYTAAAIASIAWNLPHAVLDGNVLRVIARHENDSADIASGRTRDRFRQIAQQWLDPSQPAAFNQAMMELGATVCLPRNPMCLVCPLEPSCQARVHGTAAQLPVKLRKQDPVHIEGGVLVIRRGEAVLLRQRGAEERPMAGFWELPSSDVVTAHEVARLGEIRHTITYHHYRLTVSEATIARAPREFQWIEIARLDAIPLTTTARKALKLAGVLVLSV